MAEVLDVKRREVSPIESLTLKLTGEEAEVLLFVARRIAGSISSPRGDMDQIAVALVRSGVREGNYSLDGKQASIRFLGP